MRFEGQTALVCGASAEGGTGWAIAKALAGEGARVMVAARNLRPHPARRRLDRGQDHGAISSER